MMRSWGTAAAVVLLVVAACKSRGPGDGHPKAPVRGEAWPQSVMCPPDTGSQTAEELILEIRAGAVGSNRPDTVAACDSALNAEPPSRQDPANWPMMTQKVLNAHALLPAAMGGDAEAWARITDELQGLP